MELAINIVVLCLYVVMIFCITFYTRKRNKTLNEFLLGGNSIGGIMTAFAYGTTYFSAVIFIGYAGQNGLNFGLAALWIGVGNALVGSLVAWLLLGKRTRRITHHFGARTMPEMFEKRYDCKYIKLVCSVIMFIFLVPYAASVYQGLGYLFDAVFGIPMWVVVLIMASLTALYLFFGGYFATVLSDFIQGIIMLVGVVLMVGFVVNYDSVGGIVQGLDKLFADNYGFFPSLTKGGAPFGYGILMQILVTSVGVWGLPQIVHKFHTVKNERAIRHATWGSTLFALIIGCGAYFVGCFSRYVLDGSALLGKSDTLIPQLLTKTMPAGLLGLIAVLVMSASMSTLASITLASSSAISVDLVKGYVRKNATDKSINLLMRILCLVFIAISVVIAILQPSSIINLMSFSWGTLAGCFLPPYIYGLYMRRASKVGAIASIISALTLTLTLYIISKTVPSATPWLTPPAIGVFAIVTGLIVMPVASLLSAPPPLELVDGAFTAMKTPEETKTETVETETSKTEVVETETVETESVETESAETESLVANDEVAKE